MIHDKLEEMGIILPECPLPVGSYVPTIIIGNTLYISGQIPIRNNDKVAYTGTVTDNNIAEAQESARLCAINILAQAKAALGDLERIARVIKISGFVNSTTGFSQHPRVINPASDLFSEIFGAKKGRHVRIAVGAAGLPLDAMTEIDAIFEIK